MQKTHLAMIAAAGSIALAGTIVIAPGVGASSPTTLQAVKAATSQYHSIARAFADGFNGDNEPCVSSPAGAMGVHWVNGARVGDPTLDPMEPEILLYAPGADGRLHLVGVEYMKVDADQDLTTDADRPSLFGQPFDGPMPGHSPTMPIHYDLHVWLFADNPDGTFAQFNPAVSCP
jgi:hypothetical protein